jgi:hypothetical protein
MTNRRDLGRAMISKMLDDRVRDVRRQAEQERRENLINLFRSCTVGRHLTGSQAESAMQLAAEFPGEWAEAQRLGPLAKVPRDACNGTSVPARTFEPGSPAGLT